MPSAPEIAPALPAGCVDFNKLHSLITKGDPDAVTKATVIPDAEMPAPENAVEAPASTKAE